VLAEQARDARLLVLGRHQAQPGIDVVLGSTDHGLVESVPCPVLIAGPQQRDLTDSAS
jgi:nucleotide-binding universal stress UspA family protein